MRKNIAKVKRRLRKAELKKSEKMFESVQTASKVDELIAEPATTMSDQGDTSLFQHSALVSPAQKRFIAAELTKLMLLPSMAVKSVVAPLKIDLFKEAPMRIPPDPSTQQVNRGEQIRRDDYVLHPVYLLDPDFWRKEDRDALPCRIGRADKEMKPNPSRKIEP